MCRNSGKFGAVPIKLIVETRSPMKNEKVKVLQFAKHFAPDTGGIESVTKMISEMLLPHGVVADVLCTEYDGLYEPYHADFDVIRCKSTLNFGNKRISKQYVDFVKSANAQYDCAIIHMPNPVAVYAALRYWKKPYILLWHADTPQWWVRMFTSALDRKLARDAKFIIGPTPIHLKESILASSLADNGVVVAYPFSKGRLPPALGQSKTFERVKDFADGRKISLSIGRVVAYKGFNVLVEAANQFDPSICAVVVGGGPLLPELRKLAESKKASDRVMFTGEIPDEDLADLIDIATFGCMPSVTAAEMYGVAQVEMMAHGKPMISTKLARSGVSYVNKHLQTGIVVEPNNVAQLAEGMNRLVQDADLYDELSKGAFASYKADHDIVPVSLKYVELIQQTLCKN